MRRPVGSSGIAKGGPLGVGVAGVDLSALAGSWR